MKSLQKNINPQPKEIELAFVLKQKRGKYKKMDKQRKKYLSTYFRKNPYPSRQEYQNISNELDEPIIKIENWFKHKRRMNVNNKKVKSMYKKRKNLTIQEKEVLEESFKNNPNLINNERLKLANNLNLKPKFVTNWFFYRRQKLAKIRNEIDSKEIKEKTSKENFTTELKNSINAKDSFSQQNISNVKNLEINPEKLNLIDINNNSQTNYETINQNPFFTQNLMRNPSASYNNNNMNLFSNNDKINANFFNGFINPNQRPSLAYQMKFNPLFGNSYLNNMKNNYDFNNYLIINQLNIMRMKQERDFQLNRLFNQASFHGN